jgi:hypothetical protein
MSEKPISVDCVFVFLAGMWSRSVGLFKIVNGRRDVRLQGYSTARKDRLQGCETRLTFARVVRLFLGNNLSRYPKIAKELQVIEPFKRRGCRELNTLTM